MSTQAATKPSLTLKRRFKAPPAKVFAAWTEPEKIKRWFGPAGAVCTHAEFDLRVGGKFTIVATSPGGETQRVLGVMREVVPDAKLVYTWAWSQLAPERESLVTVEFKPEGDGTLLMLLTHAQFFDEDARDRHQHGWSAALDKLENDLPRASEHQTWQRSSIDSVEEYMPGSHGTFHWNELMTRNVEARQDILRRHHRLEF